MATSHIVVLAGEKEDINTNHIFGNYGIYMCNESLEIRGLKAVGKISYAANHFRAILDLLYKELEKGYYPGYLIWIIISQKDQFLILNHIL